MSISDAVVFFDLLWIGVSLLIGLVFYIAYSKPSKKPSPTEDT